MVATHVRGPVIAALARCHAQDIERAAWALDARAAPPDSRLHRHLGSAPRAEAADDARGVPADGDGRGPSRAEVHRRRAVFGGGRDAQRPGLPVAGRRGRDPVGRDDDQPARTRSATRRPTRSRDFFAAIINRGAELRSGDVQRALPRRSRPRGGQYAGGASARGARQVECTINGDRRAGRQRVARGSRDGDSRAPRSPAVHEQHQHARRSTRPASC